MSRADLKRGALEAIEKGYESKDLETLLRACDDALDFSGSPNPKLLDDIRSEVLKEARGALVAAAYEFAGQQQLGELFDRQTQDAIFAVTDALRGIIEGPSLETLARMPVASKQLNERVRETGELFSLARIAPTVSRAYDSGMRVLNAVEHPVRVYDTLANAFAGIAALGPSGDDLESVNWAYVQVRERMLEDYAAVLDFLVMKAKDPLLVNSKLYASYKNTDPDAWPERLQRVRNLIVAHYESMGRSDAQSQGSLEIFPGDADNSAWHAYPLFFTMVHALHLPMQFTKDYVEIRYGEDKSKLGEYLRSLKVQVNDSLVSRLDQVCASQSTQQESVLVESYLLGIADRFGMDVGAARALHEKKIKGILDNTDKGYGFVRDFVRDDARMVAEVYSRNAEPGEVIVEYFRSRLPDGWLWRMFYDA